MKKTIFSVEFLYQHPDDLKYTHLCNVMFEGFDSWDKDMIESVAKSCFKAQEGLQSLLNWNK